MTATPGTGPDTGTRGKLRVAGGGGAGGGAGGGGAAVVDGEGTGEEDGDISPVGDGDSVLDSTPAVRRAAVDTRPPPATAPTKSPARTNPLTHPVQTRKPTPAGGDYPPFRGASAWWG